MIEASYLHQHSIHEAALRCGWSMTILSPSSGDGWLGDRSMLFARDVCTVQSNGQLPPNLHM